MHEWRDAIGAAYVPARARRVPLDTAARRERDTRLEPSRHDCFHGSHLMPRGIFSATLTTRAFDPRRLRRLPAEKDGRPRHPDRVLLEHDSAGDITGVKWSRRTTANLALALSDFGIVVSRNTVGRLLRHMGYALRANQRVKYYRLTTLGRPSLSRERDRWSQLVDAVGRIVNPAPASEE